MQMPISRDATINQATPLIKPTSQFNSPGKQAIQSAMWLAHGSYIDTGLAHVDDEIQTDRQFCQKAHACINAKSIDDFV